MSYGTKRAVIVAAAVLVAGVVHAVDVPLPGKVTVVKQSSLAKFKSIRTSPLIPLPTSGSADDPTIHGAQIRVFDTGNGFSTGAGDFLHSLPAAGWSALGNPPGSAGYKYKGADAGDLICKVVLIKDKKVKATCKGAAVTLNPAFVATEGVLLGIPGTTASAALRYCAAFGGTEKKNDTNTMKRKDAPQPGTCPDFVATFTPTNTFTPTATGTVTNTATATPTRTFTNTPTRTFTATPTRTFTNTPTSTNTRTATPTRTFTNTPTHTFTATPTRTFTSTPTITNTPTITATPTPTFNTHACVLDTSPTTDSQIQIHIAALPVPLSFGLSGTLSIAGEGAQADCGIVNLNPVNIPAIGFVCIGSASGCDLGTRHCGPGAGPDLGVDVPSDGNIGVCTSNAQCVTQCDAHCAGLGAGYVQFSSSCTGYCSGTTPEACTTEVDCQTPPNGACNGPDPVGSNDDICQCTCIDSATHGASDPGDVQCNLGSDLVVETGAPCNGTDVLIPVGQTCIPVTSQRATSLISDANFNPGSFVPNPPNVNDLSGLPLACATMDTSTLTGFRGVGAVNFFGSALGDLAVGIQATCQ